MKDITSKLVANLRDSAVQKVKEKEAKEGKQGKSSPKKE